jgi:uncharacterized membrane protein (DUF2068 family)
LKLVALFEAAKGVLVLAAGMGLLSLLHRDAHAIAERVTLLLHLDPASRYPKIFIDAAAGLTDARLWLLAAFACLYATFRFVEAYGLWRMRRWGEWVLDRWFQALRRFLLADMASRTHASVSGPMGSHWAHAAPP